MEGVNSVREVVRAAPDLGVSTLTLYAFSADNWKRPAAEVGRLFWILREFCIRERDELVANGVHLTTIGRRDRIPGSALKRLRELEAATARGTRLSLRLAIDYSAQAEIARAAREIAQRVEEGVLEPSDMTADLLRQMLTAGVPDPDLLIRTAGEQRLSDFLLWELAYAELVFTRTLWPDFRRAQLASAIDEFRRRERKFGGLTPRPHPTAEPRPDGLPVGR